jgi:hypothetical protein
MYTSSTSTNTAYLKPLITGAVAVAGDKFLFNEQDMQKSLFFGLAVGAGSFAGNYVGSNIAPALLPTVGFIDGKTLEVRLAEVGSGAAAAYLLNTQFLKNDFEYSQMYPKLALIAGSDFIAEYLIDFYEGKPPSFFS